MRPGLVRDANQSGGHGWLEGFAEFPALDPRERFSALLGVLEKKLGQGRRPAGRGGFAVTLAHRRAEQFGGVLQQHVTIVARLVQAAGERAGPGAIAAQHLTGVGDDRLGELHFPSGIHHNCFPPDSSRLGAVCHAPPNFRSPQDLSNAPGRRPIRPGR